MSYLPLPSNEYGGQNVDRRALALMQQQQQQQAPERAQPYNQPQALAPAGGMTTTPYAPSRPVPSFAAPLPAMPAAAPAAPAAPVAPAQKYAVGGMVGSKLADTSYTKSPKYVLGRVMEQFDPKSMLTPQGQQAFLEKLKADPSGFYKDARLDGDKLFYTGQRGQPVTIDMLHSYDAGKPTWQYLTNDEQGKAGQTPVQSALGSVTGNLTTSGLLQAILRQLGLQAQGASGDQSWL